jgi:signal peptidase I
MKHRLLAHARVVCLGFLAVVMVAGGAGGRLAVISGASMEQTFHDGDVAVVLDLTDAIGGSIIRSHWTRRGQVVLLRPPGEGRLFVKRIVAKGGDRINIWQGRVVLNGEGIDEPYVTGGRSDVWPISVFTRSPPAVQVPMNNLFVLGDNRDNSTDSRLFGSVPTENVVAIVVGVLPSSLITLVRSLTKLTNVNAENQIGVTHKKKGGEERAMKHLRTLQIARVSLIALATAAAARHAVAKYTNVTAIACGHCDGEVCRAGGTWDGCGVVNNHCQPMGTTGCHS